MTVNGNRGWLIYEINFYNIIYQTSHPKKSISECYYSLRQDFTVFSQSYTFDVSVNGSNVLIRRARL